MSRARSRARRRRARFESVRAEFQEKRSNPGAFAKLLQRIADSDQCLWAVARSAARDNPLDDEEQAMVTQAVAPDLAAMTPGSVYARRELAN
jgi:hypothetical protein